MNINLDKYNEAFLLTALPIIEHEEYKKMRSIPHHHGSVYEHSLDVAYLAFRIARRLRLDCVSTARGALLHDFYLYKFKKRKNKNLLAEGFRHSRNHPKIAFQNAVQHFEVNAKEKDIITNHMFPVGLPRSFEAWITTFADKTYAIAEYSSRARYFMQYRWRRTYVPQVLKKAE